ncbi:hypothetical protein D3C85_1843780 [compost metagenome]
MSAADTFVLSEHVADLPRANTNISGRDIRVRTNVAVQLSHKALGKSHDLPVRLAFGIEIGTAFSAADRQAG